MPVTKVKVNGEWVPAMPVGGGGEGDMTKAVYDTNDDGVVDAADQATKDGSGNVITSTYAAKATTLSGYGITDAKIQNGSIILGGNSITPLTSFTETDPVFTASAAHGISSSDITNWNNKSNTDEKVKQESLNGSNSGKNFLFTSSLQTTDNVTSTITYGRYIRYNDYSQSLTLISRSDSTKTSSIAYDYFSINNGTYSTYLRATTPTADRLIYLPDKGGTVALASTTLSGYGITDAYISNGTITLGSNSITPLTSYTETDPVFTASVAAGITSTDITNWNNKISDDHKWNDVSLNKGVSGEGTDVYIPQLLSLNATSANLTIATSTPNSYFIAKYESGGYLMSNTPTSTDNSTKVATTAFVQTALSGISLDGYIASDTTANFTVSDTAPSNPQAGDVWIDMSSDGIPMANGVDF